MRKPQRYIPAGDVHIAIDGDNRMVGFARLFEERNGVIETIKLINMVNGADKIKTSI